MEIHASRKTHRTRVKSDEAAAAMERYAAGQPGAFDQLYDRLRRRLYAYLLRRTNDPHVTEDLLQQTLLRVHCARTRFVAGADVFSWVLAIARRLAIDSARTINRREMYTGDVETLGVPTGTARADEILEARQTARLLEDELGRMPASQRIAFDLMNRQGLSLSEAADALQITIGALKVRVHRAHRALRAALAATV